MVNFKVPNQNSKADPLGVQVKYDSRGQPRSAVAKVAIHEGDKPTTMVIEFEIEGSTARLREFREPRPITRKHFCGLPAATRQLQRVSCVDRVERPEKTLGDAIMKGLEMTNSEINDPSE